MGAAQSSRSGSIFNAFNKVTSETANVSAITAEFKGAEGKEAVEALLAQISSGESFVDYILGKVFIELYDAQASGANHANRTQKLEAFAIILQKAREVGVEDVVFLDRIAPVVKAKPHQKEEGRESNAVKMLQALITGHFEATQPDYEHQDQYDLVLKEFGLADNKLTVDASQEVHYKLSHNEYGLVAVDLMAQELGIIDLD